MKKVLYGGTFDVFHWMHLESIRRAKAEGDYLVVMVNSDKLVSEYKGRPPTFSERERADIIRNLRDVDEVVLKDTFGDIPYMEQHNVDVFVVCEEWKEQKQEEERYMQEERGGRVVYLPYVEAEFMQKHKDRVRESLNAKTKLLCEDCHRKI